MGVSINTRQAYSEVDEFLGLISNEHRNKIPKKLREFFREEKDTNYIKGINPNVPIKNQKLKEETLGIIALLNLQYWYGDFDNKIDKSVNKRTDFWFIKVRPFVHYLKNIFFILFTSFFIIDSLYSTIERLSCVGSFFLKISFGLN